MIDLTSSNELIMQFDELIRNKEMSDTMPYKVGVDLGTANIVISVVDENDNPVAGVLREASVVKDGIVVDYIGAAKIVSELKTEIEQIIGTELNYAATAIPPGIIEGNVKVITNVVESAGFEVTNVIDEPTAAASVLAITDGAVVDVGGGTTGISILKDGEVIFTADEPTGGTHMSLVTAGFFGASFEEAELIKKDKNREKEIFMIVKPVIEKMAGITKRFLEGFDVDTVYVVGGASCIDGFEKVFEKEIGITTIKPVLPLLVTPLGIAINSNGSH